MYGRLADPESTLGTDPRADPRMVKAFAPFGLDGRLPAAPLTVDSPLADRLEYAAINEEGMGTILDVFAQAAPQVTGVTTTTTQITGVDDNAITVYVSRPDGAPGALPAVVHLHGGGMAIGSAGDVSYRRLREYLAATGVVVVGVNGYRCNFQPLQPFEGYQL